MNRATNLLGPRISHNAQGQPFREIAPYPCDTCKAEDACYAKGGGLFCTFCWQAFWGLQSGLDPQTIAGLQTDGAEVLTARAA